MEVPPFWVWGWGEAVVELERAMNSIVVLITASRASRYFLTTGVRSAITKRVDEQARRSLETVKVHREG